MLRLEDIRISRDEFELGADLEVPRGARIAVMGPSGAGKSTLLSVIAGFLPVRSGRISWEGADLTGRDPADRPVAMLFQDNNLFPHLDAARNVGLGLKPNGRLGSGDRARVAAALGDVGLHGLGARMPSELSGGQQSRVAIARATLQDRPLLLLDEPFSALGPALKAEMIALVRRICDDRGLTVLMITHDPDDARRLGGGIIVVADGIAAPPRETEALLDDPPPALAEYLTGRTRP